MSTERSYEEPDSTYPVDYISISSRSRSRLRSCYRTSPPLKKKFKSGKRRSASSSSSASVIQSDRRKFKRLKCKKRSTDSKSNNKISRSFMVSRSRSTLSRRKSSVRSFSASRTKSRSRHSRRTVFSKSSRIRSIYKNSRTRSLESSRSRSISRHYTRSNTGHFRTESVQRSRTRSIYQNEYSKSRSVTTLSKISGSYQSNKLRDLRSFSSNSSSVSQSYPRSASLHRNSFASKSFSDRERSLENYKQREYSSVYSNYRRSYSKYRSHHRSIKGSRSVSLRLHSRKNRASHQNWYRYDYLNRNYSRKNSYEDEYAYYKYRSSSNYRKNRKYCSTDGSSNHSYDYDITISYKKHRAQKRKSFIKKYKSGKRKRSVSDSYYNDKHLRSYYREDSVKYLPSRNWRDRVEKASKYADSLKYDRKPSYRNNRDKYVNNYRDRSYDSREATYYSKMYLPAREYHDGYYYSRRNSPAYNDYRYSDKERSWRGSRRQCSSPYNRLDKWYNDESREVSSRKKATTRRKRNKRSSTQSSGDTSSSSCGRRLSDCNEAVEDIEIKQGVRNTKDGHLVYKPGDLLLDKYKIISTLGEGTFGKVVEALDSTRSGKRVAIKIIRNVTKYREAAELEVDVLEKLAEKDDGDNSSLCVKLLSAFDFHGHACLSFDILGQSVFDFLKTNSYQPYTLPQIRHISYQLCHAVKFLHDNKLTHTDLKPENILFVNSDFDPIAQPGSAKEYKSIRYTDIRLIDFGSATFDHEHHTKIVSTRQYRALEVILELGWDHSCDVWSIGCILFELYTGHTLFQTHSNIEHLAMIEKILGGIPSRMCKKSKKKKYFTSGHLDWDKQSRDGRYVENNCYILKTYLSKTATSSDHHLFDLISRMLEFDPKRRIDLKAAKAHEFHQPLLATTDN